MTKSIPAFRADDAPAHRADGAFGTRKCAMLQKAAEGCMSCIQCGSWSAGANRHRRLTRQRIGLPNLPARGQSAGIQRRRDPDLSNYEERKAPLNGRGAGHVRDGASAGDGLCGKPLAVDRTGLVCARSRHLVSTPKSASGQNSISRRQDLLHLLVPFWYIATQCPAGQWICATEPIWIHKR
jgi:hypothetical protein